MQIKASALFICFFFPFSLIWPFPYSSLTITTAMADNSVPRPSSKSEASVHIIYTDKPENEEPESYHLRTLASVLGSEEAAREALVYSYKQAASGFSAKLTPEQVTEMSTMADNSVPQPSSKSEASVHIIYTDKPENEEPEYYHLRTLASVLGSEEAAREALVYCYKQAASGFSAKLTPEQVTEMSKQPGVLQVVPSRTLQLHSGPGKLHV